MIKNKTSIFDNGLIWFGAAVSIAEILTGTLIAPLGFEKGIKAIILGHIIGAILMYFAGIIGANTEKSAMETVKMSFGKKGSFLFSSLNVLQLVGWTAVMIVSGASAANSIVSFGGTWIWSLIIGLLILIWIIIGIKKLGKINIFAMSSLFILSIILCLVVFRGEANLIKDSSMSFGYALELSIAMPLSWLPLISDYTRNAKDKKKATFTSVGVYALVSSWMYIIGMGAAIFTGESDIANIMVSAGFGMIGLLIIVLSTVTTTFLDVYSAGVSSVSISSKINEKKAAIVVCLIGIIFAIFIPVTQYENFLYLIGSVFAPMISIQITDYYINKRNTNNINFNFINLFIWVIGFGIYRVFININTPIGSTIPVIIITSVLSILLNKLLRRKKC
jgi:putative hydroxymethylpyrimidine transporter CytX